MLKTKKGNNSLIKFFEEATNQNSFEYLTYHCKLVTPMYGGGVKAGEIDEKMPVRATAIRGQLRFWWRLLYSIKNNISSSNELFIKERSIWGGLGNEDTLSSSKVRIVLSKFSVPKMEQCVTYVPNNTNTRLNPDYKDWCNDAKYALFPCIGKANGLNIEIDPPFLVREGLEWDMRINISDALPLEDRNLIVDSIRWWSTFGGVGARTRRGLGAVEVSKITGDTQELQLVAESEILSPFAFKKKFKNNKAMDAWQEGIKLLETYRQGVNLGRNPGTNTPGRSRWPEPAAIRKLTGKYRVKNEQVNGQNISFIPSAEDPEVFPRAAFGLPIIFHFQNWNTLPTHRDPEDLELKPIGSERMSSPLIIRPYRTNKTWHTFVLMLPTTHVWDMQLELNYVNRNNGNFRNINAWWPKDDTQQNTLTDGISPLRGRGLNSIDAFMRYFENPNTVVLSQKVTEQEIEMETWTEARITPPSSNGTMTAEKDGKKAMALNTAGTALFNSLSDDLKQSLVKRRFCKANVNVIGDKLIGFND